jgi:hypothetical protein
MSKVPSQTQWKELGDFVQSPQQLLMSREFAALHELGTFKEVARPQGRIRKEVSLSVSHDTL